MHCTLPSSLFLGSGQTAVRQFYDVVSNAGNHLHHHSNLWNWRHFPIISESIVLLVPTPSLVGIHLRRWLIRQARLTHPHRYQTWRQLEILRRELRHYHHYMRRRILNRRSNHTTSLRFCVHPMACTLLFPWRSDGCVGTPRSWSPGDCCSCFGHRSFYLD